MYIAHNPQKNVFILCGAEGSARCFAAGAEAGYHILVPTAQTEQCTRFSLFSSDSRPIPEIAFFAQKVQKNGQNQ